MRLLALLICLTLSTSSPAHVVSFDTIDVSAHQQMLRCADICRLYLCNDIQDRRRVFQRPPGNRNAFRGNGILMGGAICKGTKQQLVDVKSCEAFVSPVKSSVPKVRISKYSPPGLSPPFSKRYLKVREGPGRENRIVRGRSAGNQNEYAHMLCVRVPITKYRVLYRNGTTGGIVRTRNAKDCVSFKGTGSKLEFHLQWNTTDDLDVFLFEPLPSSCVLSKFNRSCPSGATLIRDNGEGHRCRPYASGSFMIRERIMYPFDSTVRSGKYSMIVQHKKNCGLGPTSYNVWVAVDGNVVQKKTGVTNRFDSDFAATYNFDIKV